MADASRVIVRSPSDAFIGEISPSDIFAMTRTEEVNGEHSLEITTTVVLQKEMRLLTADHTGKWHEWVVMGEDTDHASGLTPIGTYYAVWSIQHDLALTKVDKMPGTQSPVSASVALTDALSGTKRWEVGTVTVGTTGGASMWYQSGWAALSTVVDVWGGEIDATITVANDGTVTARRVDLYSKMGQQTAKRRFDWGHDLKGIRRKVDEAPMAVRIIPRGKGEETGTGGYGRKITIESVNGGVEWLQNDQTAPLYRLPDGQGGWEYPTIVVENGSIEDPQELKDWGLDVLEDYTTPRVTYESDVMQLAQAGMDVTGISLGDAVQCVDKGFSEDGLRVSGRVTRMAVNELDETDVQLTIGHLAAGLAGSLSSISKLTATVAAMNGGSLSTADYLNRLLDRINGEINATGGYTYVTQGQGLRTYDKRVSNPLVGSEATKVVEIKGGTIRIADSRTSQGEWEWKTVFVSGHIAANLVTAVQVTAGRIQSADGKSYWDLDGNHFVTRDADLEGKVTAKSGEIGGMTISESTLENELMVLKDNALVFKRRSNQQPCGAVVSVKGNSGDTLNGVLLGAGKPTSSNSGRILALGADMDISDDGKTITTNMPFLFYTTEDWASDWDFYDGGIVHITKPTEIHSDTWLDSDIYVTNKSTDTTRKGLTTTLTVGDKKLLFYNGVFVDYRNAT